MPQFETTYYFSQIFWMLISFGILYTCVRRIIFPMFDVIFIRRAATIQESLDEAERANARAETLAHQHLDFVAETERMRQELINKAHEKLQVEVETHEKHENQAITRQIQRVEDRLMASEEISDASLNVWAKGVVEHFVHKIESPKKTRKGVV